MKNILVLCTGNSCRSVIGEALVNHLGGTRFTGYSAGSQPTGQVNSGALSVLQQHGVDTSGLSSKGLEVFTETPIDLVITVCDNAAAEACPIFPGNTLKVHWGLPDPAGATGDQETISAAFEMTFQQLEQRISALIALPDDLSDSEWLGALAQIHEHSI
ncbi:MAG: low molecular weight phosphatase family protein [Oceanospirillales bacterium LUC14_002_19_P2]|nr:MAG: low molecular weight phosphatase family protein [Oceanospirillales bacterium LUC14_002_19_P2]